MDRAGSTGTSVDAIILASPLEWGDRRKVVPWLLASLLVHVAVGGWWLQRQALPVYEFPAVSPTLQLRFRKPAPDTVQEPTPQPPVPAPTEEEFTRIAPLPPTAAPAPLPAQTRTAPLDLSLPDVAAPEPEVSTDNGATVLDTELLGRLQRAPRRTGYSARSEREASGDFQAGGWVEFVREGDRCFRVARANPLASADYDVWYRVPCPG